jgi:hypothetical protein
MGCYLAGVVNYITFGVMCSLCDASFGRLFLAGKLPIGTEPPPTVFPTAWLVSPWSKIGMAIIIGAYKLSHYWGALLTESIAWASAGYDGWPEANNTPTAGQTPRCATNCKRTDVPTFTGYPYGFF